MHLQTDGVVTVIEPGLVHIRNCITDERCQEIAKEAMEWAEKENKDGFYTSDTDGKKVLNTGEPGRGRIYDKATRFSPRLTEDCYKAVSAARALDSEMPSMTCTHLLINMYTTPDGLVWHRDIYENDGRSDHPVVLLSVGASARFGFKHNDGDPVREVVLKSGDVLLFGGPCRLIKHSVLEILLHDSPAWMDPKSRFRLSVTFRDSPEVLGREEEFKYFQVAEHLVGQKDFENCSRRSMKRLSSLPSQRKFSFSTQSLTSVDSEKSFAL